MALNTARKLTRLAPEDRIAEILAQARIVLAEKGYENFLAAEVAARCGVSEATVYRYFPTKRELLEKVAERWFDEIMAVEPEIAQLQDVYQQLRHLIHHSLMVVRKEPVLTRFVLLELRPDPAYRSSHIYLLNRVFTATLSQVIKDAVAKGVFRKDIPPSLARDMIFGCIEHQTWAYLRGEGDFSVEASADGIAKIIYQGLAAAPVRERELVGAALQRLEAGAAVLGAEVDALRAQLERSGAKPVPQAGTD